MVADTSPTKPIDPRPRTVPQPPRLWWGWLLLLEILTFGLFGIIWLPIQALWAKRMTGVSESLRFATIHACILPGSIVLAVLAELIGILGADAIRATILTLWPLVRLVYIVTYFAAIFSLRWQLQSNPINIRLNGLMTFFFGPIYFQFYLEDYVLPSAEKVYGQFKTPSYTPPTAPEPTP